ncbi:MAG: hypothetical protein GY856_39735, partial [bacterium]|nr:hypothetical protein [bacterium]
ESAEIGLLIVAMPWDSTPIARLLPVADHAERAPGEIRRTLGDQGVEASVWILGPQREELSSRLAADGFEVREETMPTCGSETLPADVELALRLAEAEEVAALSGPRLDKRHRSMRWAQRVAWAGIALALLGAFLVVVGSATLLRNRVRQDALRAEAPGVGEQIRQLQEIVALAEEVRRLHAEVAAHGLPWPRLAPTVAGLAQQRPPGVGWERLEIAGRKLELQVSASGPMPFDQLELVRSALESSPGLVNVAWDEP